MVKPAILLLSMAMTEPALAQAQAADTITVTATRTPARLADTPSSVVVVSSEAIATSAAPTTDDLLRQVPGFTLFRRTGSRTANPTSQGVSLRGVGASGASRALVLDDGIPLNDPFGGWVYWDRVPRSALERIEVLRGGASDLYGSSAMGGVIQFFRRSPAKSSMVIDSSVGSEGTATTSLFAAVGSGQWRGSLALDFFTTAGFVPTAPNQRGAVDSQAGGRHSAIDATIERELGTSGRVFVRGSNFLESRDNGTPLQTNDTTIRQLAGGLDDGPFLLRAYGSSQHYHQLFSAIAADRGSERLTIAQEVPSHGSGLTLQWAHPAGLHHAIVAGIDARHVAGASNEEQFALNGTASAARSEGKQSSEAAFIEDVASLTNRLTVTAGLRVDRWRNDDASRNDVPLPDRADVSWSPRLSILYRASERFALTGSAYRAFRAPTLNELYRGFRVGNVITLPNEALGPETLTAVEVGVRASSVRVTAFWMRTDDVVANVTLTTTPTLITRQRQNLGSSRSRGAEVEGDWPVMRSWRISAGYLFCDATVTAGGLAGRRLPQVPRSQGTLQSSWNAARAKSGAQVRWSSSQFDDDVNEFRLRGFFVADVFQSFELRSSLSLTIAVENIFDRQVEAAATPVISVAQPRVWRVGLRMVR
jgi:outer membrane receptor protein involved in Fe transport